MSLQKYDSRAAKRKLEFFQLVTTRIPQERTSEAVVQFYQALGTPKALAAYLLFVNGEWEQLFSLKADPLHYEDGARFRDDYLVCNLLKQSNFIDSGIDKESRAMFKFLSFEHQCRKTNERFREVNFLSRPEDPKIGPLNTKTSHEALLRVMSRKIFKILGACDPDELMDLASWGPGVSTLVKGVECSAPQKFQYETGVTRDLYPLAAAALSAAYPGWDSLLKNSGFPHFEVGDVVITVPKTSMIDRVIAIQPGINLWFQLGLGRMMRRRLARTGIDLSSQRRNQQMARAGSLSNRIATVDFSSASDSIAKAMVETAFRLAAENCGDPKQFREFSLWYELMDIFRSRFRRVGKLEDYSLEMTQDHFGSKDGDRVRLGHEWEKFSTMGNGFTFELETLIFYCAAYAVVKQLGLNVGEISVFGDDVILPSKAYDLFSSFSSYLGFTVNPVKSFSSGPFRESCGSHYFRGIDCKPVYLQNALSSIQEVYNFANLVRLRSHDPQLGYCDARFAGLFNFCRRLVPSKLRYGVSCVVEPKSGEVTATEGGFISNLDEARPTRAKHGFLGTKGLEGWVVKRVAWIAKKREVDHAGLLQSALHSLERGESNGLRLATESGGNLVPLRQRTKCVKVSTLFQTWYDLGPWL